MSVEGPESEPYQPAANPYQQVLKNAAVNHRLFSVHWELTYRCNERCTHCYLDVLPPGAKVPEELTTEECFQIIDQLAEMGVLNLAFSGGEVLVRRDWYDIGKYARSKKLLLRLYTNGILIKPAVADKIADLHPHRVEISLYSTKPEVHDGITRVKGSWNATAKALRLLHERGVRTIVKTPLMRENVYEIDSFEEFARENGANFQYDVTITPKNDGGLDPLQHRITYDQLVWLMEKRIDPQMWLKRDIPQDRGTCGIGMKAVALDPYGNVYPCLETRFNAGNLRQKSLKEIWEQSGFWDPLNHLTLSELPVCRTCELRNLCVRCHGLALNEDGDLMAPALTNCREALARRQALINKGALPEDFPVPEHLRRYVDDDIDRHIGSRASSGNLAPINTMIPMESIL